MVNFLIHGRFPFDRLTKKGVNACLCGILILIFCAGCSTSAEKQEEAQAAVEEIEVPDVPEDHDELDAIDDEPVDLIDPDTQDYYDSAVASLTKKYEGYEISVSTATYEASSSITWMIGEDLEPLSYKESYAVESMEGAREYYYENGKISCYMEEASGGDETETTYYCTGSRGIKIKRNDAEGTSTTEILESGDLKLKEQMMDQNFNDLLKLLKEYEVTTKGDVDYTISIEEDVEFDGIEATNKTVIVISKDLYLRLVSDDD
jgi:hypothetical protein